MNVSEHLSVTAPDNMTFEQAASMPAVYSTAIYCLLDASKLDEGMVQSILIHSAAGSVGITAIRIAQMVGAEDAFVSYRHSLGLAASAVNIGVIGDIGYYIMMEAELLDCLKFMLKRSRPTQHDTAVRRDCGKKQSTRAGTFCYVQSWQVWTGLRSLLPITAPKNRKPWRRDPRMLVYRNLKQGSGAEATLADSTSPAGEELSRSLRDIVSNMAMLRSDEAATLLAREVGRTLFGFHEAG
ncbi:hypothetical protein Daus18300_008949 [Diaporthe australafricana]|uniref:Polyketide synthase n=1 Tax=Diaporthe australafricana TaxID=127596 RepID=A0ABR3WGI6_9PEZI